MVIPNGNAWGYIILYAASGNTQYEAWLGPVYFIKLVEAVVLPLQWSHAYLSLDSFASKVTLEVGMVE